MTADADGVLQSLDAMAVGLAAWRLGAGRARPGEAVQAAAGVELHAKPGDRVRAGQPLLTPAHRHPGADPAGPAGPRGRVHDRGHGPDAHAPGPRPHRLAPGSATVP